MSTLWGASVVDVSALSTLRGMVRTVGSTTDAFSLRVVRTYWRFCPLRLLCRRRPVQECQLAAGQKGPKARRLDGPVSLKIVAVPVQ
jgi:hypothetical protein